LNHELRIHETLARKATAKDSTGCFLLFQK